LQAIWISVTAVNVFFVNAIAPADVPALNWGDLVGVCVWLAAFGIEVVADRQKSAWRMAKDRGEHNELFISSGLVRWFL
jgi:steroid 5-alpha reductase family enzyme